MAGNQEARVLKKNNPNQHKLQPTISTTSTPPTFSAENPMLYKFTPFPAHSVNLFTGPTSVGKTHYVSHILNNYRIYFEAEVKRILVVLCNDRIDPLDLSPGAGVLVEQLPIEQFHFDVLEEGDLVVIDDIQDLTHPILEHTISVGAHHYKLASLFLVTHSLLGHRKNFSALAKVHRVFLFLRATSNSRLCKYLIDNFFHDKDTKDYLKEILAFCIRGKQVLALEINSIVSSKNLPLLAFSHLDSLATDSYCIVYPMPLTGLEYEQDFTGQVEKTLAAGFPYQDTSSLPRYSLVAVPAQAVVLAKTKGGKIEDGGCSDERTKWKNLNIELENMIEDHINFPKWQIVKNLAKAIISNKRYCIMDNGKYIYIHGKPVTKVSFIDFAKAVTRKPGPKEQRKKDSETKLYAYHVEQLLSGGAFRDIFLNKLLLPKKYQ